jgi:hypothetical protein
MFALRLLLLFGFLAITYGVSWMVRAKRLRLAFLPIGCGLAMLLVTFGMPASAGVALERSAIIGGAVALVTTAISGLVLYLLRDRLVIPRPLFCDFVVRPWPPQVKRRAVRLALFAVAGIVADLVWYGMASALGGLSILLAFATAEWATAVSQKHRLIAPVADVNERSVGP